MVSGSGRARVWTHEGGMGAQSAPRIEPKGSKYYYRRSSLKGGDVLRALGIGLAAGAAVFYVARIFFQKTPLIAPEGARRAPRRLRTPHPGGG
jgi:hypothetical protein